MQKVTHLLYYQEIAHFATEDTVKREFKTHNNSMFSRKTIVLATLLTLGLGSTLLITNVSTKKSNDIITVSDLSSTTSKCQKDEKCYEESINNIFKERGLEYATAYLGELAKGNGLLLNCHNVAHALGREAYRSLGDSTLKYNITLCSEGFNHGVVNGASENLAVEEYPKLFTDYCMLNKEQIMGCTHGIGHILAKKEVSELVVQNTCMALKSLIEEKVPLRNEEVSRAISDLSGNCIDGWAMQRIEDMGVQFPKEFTLVSFCEGITSFEREFCLGEFERNVTMRSFSDEKIMEFTQYCQERPTENFRAVCGFYVGQSLQENTISKPQLELGTLFKTVCQKGESPMFQTACTLGFITKKINYNIRPEENEGFCRLLRRNLADVCLTEIANFKK